MKIPIGDHSITLRDGPEAMIVDVGMDDETLHVQFLESGLIAGVDFTIEDLRRFQSLIDDAIENAFEAQPEIRCPACGYTREDARMHGDHRFCRKYPFFPGEKGKTKAIG